MPQPERSRSPTKLPQPKHSLSKSGKDDALSQLKLENHQDNLTISNEAPKYGETPNKSPQVGIKTSQGSRLFKSRVSTAPPSAFKYTKARADQDKTRCRSRSQPGLRDSGDASVKWLARMGTNSKQPVIEQAEVISGVSLPSNRDTASKDRSHVPSVGGRQSSSDSRSRSHTRSSFSNNQQQYSTAQPRADMALTRAQRPSTTSSPSLSSSTNDRSKKPGIFSAQLQWELPPRVVAHQQILLLQLHVLRLSAVPTHAAWLESAYTKLLSRHRQCQSLYTQHLRLARSARQMQNLLAMHCWSNGNLASLTRKLGVLNEVLREVIELIDQPRTNASAHPGYEQIESRDQIASGLFMTLTTQFEAWMNLVQETWTSRDLLQESSSMTSQLPVAQHRASMHDSYDQVRVGSRVVQQIPGLGDGVKLQMRTLSTALDRLVLQLSDLRDPPVPSHILEDSKAFSQLDESEQGSIACSRPRNAAASTPHELVEIVWKLVQGMREEIQAMREAEFEVIVGEEAWMNQSMRRLSHQVAGAFITSNPSHQATLIE